MMVRNVIMLAAGVAIVGWSASALAGEGCAHAKKASADSSVKLVSDGDGFKDGSAILYGVKVVSEKLFSALVGMEMDKDKVGCPACKKALETNGECSHCGIGAVNGVIYHSPVAYRLAKGMVISEEKKNSCSCGACKKAYAEDGKCEHCGVGFVAGRMYKGDEDYQAALAAHKILERSVKAASMCEECAVAMVTNGTCEHCKVKFTDGTYAKVDQ